MEVYNKLQLLGKGTFGTVYLCERKHNNLKLVVKEINNDLDSTQMKAAKNEVAILKSLKHPNVIEYYDSFAKGGTFYIVMGYARHGNLYEFLLKRRGIHLEKDILMGLHHIHSKKIVHRDLKCENIFLSGRNNDIVKIGDFGISKALATTNNKTNTVIGTTNYIAPEICDGLDYDTKSDIWSLGCILYELSTLKRLFDGTLGNIILSIKRGKRKLIDIEYYGANIQSIIDACVHMSPECRPTAAAILVDSYIFPIVHELMLSLGNIISE